MVDIEVMLANGPQTVMLRPEAILAFLLVPLLLAGGTFLLVRRWPFLGRIAFIVGIIVALIPIAVCKDAKELPCIMAGLSLIYGPLILMPVVARRRRGTFEENAVNESVAASERE